MTHGGESRQYLLVVPFKKTLLNNKKYNYYYTLADDMTELLFFCSNNVCSMLCVCVCVSFDLIFCCVDNGLGWNMNTHVYNTTLHTPTINFFFFKKKIERKEEVP